MSSYLKSLSLWVCLLLIAGVLTCAQEAAPAGAAKAQDGAKVKEEKKDKEKGDKKKKDKGKEKEKAKDGEKEKDKAKDKKPGKEGEKAGSDGRISLPLTAGIPSKGLKIPYYDGQGNLQMVFTIGIATKLDTDSVEMQQMQVETYNEEGEPEMTVDLPTSVLDLNTRVVTSNTKTKITREDFVITGDSIRFNTVTKQGTLVGNVHMTINNLNEEVASQTPEQPSNE